MPESHPFSLSGLGVALITPFRHDGAVDVPALEALVSRIINGGADFLVVLGTTAETPTLDEAERQMVKDTVRRVTDGRVPLVLGSGGNDTRHLAQSLRNDDTEGFSAILSVVPFYNKPSQEGIYRHYMVLAEASPLPLILYNVPGRTGVNMTADTTLRLAHECPRIIGVKEASGSEEQTARIVDGAPDSFKVISGDDAQTLPFMRRGATGVISVIANAYPAGFERMVHLASAGRYDEAEEIERRFAPICHHIFTDGNPAGIKSLLAAQGHIENILRLPLVEVSSPTAAAIAAELPKLADLL